MSYIEFRWSIRFCSRDDLVTIGFLIKLKDARNGLGSNYNVKHILPRTGLNTLTLADNPAYCQRNYVLTVRKLCSYEQVQNN